MVAPKLFIALIDNRNGVALGTTSMSSHMRFLPCMRGICSCLKLYKTWLLPNLKPTLLGCSRMTLRMLCGNFCKTAGTKSLPMTLRLAPVSMIARPEVDMSLAMFWLLWHSAASLVVKMTFFRLGNAFLSGVCNIGTSDPL